MNRRDALQRVAALALGAATTPAAAQRDPGAPEAGGRIAPPAIGTRIELPGVRLLDGRELAPDHWRGKVLVVESWASWCPVCRQQHPHLDQLHRSQAAIGLEVLALSMDRRPEEAQRYMREHGYAFHAAMFDGRWQAAIGRPKGLPTVWVIGRDARLRQFETGEMFPEDVEELARWAKP